MRPSSWFSEISVIQHIHKGSRKGQSNTRLFREVTVKLVRILSNTFEGQSGVNQKEKASETRCNQQQPESKGDLAYPMADK